MTPVPPWENPDLSLDITVIGQLRARPVSFLRSSFFIAIVSALVLAGYVSDVLDYDCESEKQEQTTQSDTHSGKDAPAEKGDCQCLCHQIFTTQAAAPVRIASGTPGVADYLVQPDEFPPDAVPLGIEYPPQLA